MKRLFPIFYLNIVLFVFFISVPGSAEEYTVGEGDVLEINVYENPDLSTKARVSAGNTIRIPLAGEINVENHTVSQIAIKVENLLSNGYLVNPQVDVFIAEHRSKQAIILGQIKSPGQYELRGDINFLEFISKAGGLTKDAGSTATIKRTSGDTNEKTRIVIDLDKLVKEGEASLNISIQHNDSIYIPEAKTYYVSGEVEKPDSYKFESDLTVIKAITVAGGFSKIAAKKSVRVIRVVNGKKTIFKKVNMDLRILPDDIIVVPESFF